MADGSVRENGPRSLKAPLPPHPFLSSHSASHLFLLQLSNDFLKAWLVHKPRSEEEEEATRPGVGM